MPLRGPKFWEQSTLKRHKCRAPLPRFKGRISRNQDPRLKPVNQVAAVRVRHS